MQYKVAMIGDKVSLAGFKPLGVATYPLDRESQAREVWAEALTAGYAVIFVTEPVYSMLEREIALVASLPTPAVTIIPSVTSSGGVGGAKLEKAVERALGTKMPISNDEQ